MFLLLLEFMRLLKDRGSNVIEPGNSAGNATYAVSGVMTILGLNFNQWMMFGGFVLGAATFAVNWYYKRQHLKLVTEMRDENAAKKELIK